MAAVADLLQAIDGLHIYATQLVDDPFRLTVEGEALGEPEKAVLLQIFDLAEQLNLTLQLTATNTDDSVGTEDLASDVYDDEPWRLSLGKTQLTEHLRSRENEATLLFCSVEGFHQWLERIDPFVHSSGPTPDLTQPTTIRIKGLTAGFGGPSLWVLPLDGVAPEIETVKLPNMHDVQGLIHIRATKALRVCPDAYALTWGNLDSQDAAPLVRLSICVLSACLVQELRCTNDVYEATLQGTKRLALPLYDEDQEVSVQTLEQLVSTVCWVYEERSETRLGLIMDRMSIDIERGQSLLSGIVHHLEAALRQARDSYAFVILERKDAYHKEVRELMKDMKAQADLYASKVRDLVSALTRDTLGVLVFIAFSFIGKFDKQNFHTLLMSNELALVVKLLSGYLVLSLVLQLATHCRDMYLSDQESRTWLDELQHYSSHADKQNRFLEPIKKRQITFSIALCITTAAYLIMAWMTWYLPDIISSMLYPTDS